MSHDDLVAALTRGDRAQRLTAMDALAARGDRRAVGPLLARYRDPREESIVREMALVAVARLGDPDVFSYVMDQLPSALATADPSGVRAYMLGKALLESGPGTLPGVIEFAKSGEPRRRDWAITLLGFYRGQPAALAALLDLAHSPDAQIRRRVMDSLGQLFMRRAAPAIQAALSDPDPAVRAAAAHAWRNVGYLVADGGSGSR